MQLTESQREIYDYVKEFHAMFHYMPSTRDIQDKFKFKSQTAAVNHLKAICAKGYLQRIPGKARALLITR